VAVGRPVYFHGFGLFLVDPLKTLVVIPPKIRHNILLVMPSNSDCKSFQISWIDKFGVKIASRDCTTSKVVSLKCLFCENMGRKRRTMVLTPKVKSKNKQQMSSISKSLGDAIILVAT
jgi:hypothetical protein